MDLRDVRLESAAVVLMAIMVMGVGIVLILKAATHWTNAGGYDSSVLVLMSWALICFLAGVFMIKCRNL